MLALVSVLLSINRGAYMAGHEETDRQDNLNRRDLEFHRGAAIISAALRIFSHEHGRLPAVDLSLDSALENIRKAHHCGFEASPVVPEMRERARQALGHLVYARYQYAKIEGTEEAIKQIDSISKELLDSLEDGSAIIVTLREKSETVDPSCSPQLVLLMKSVATVATLLQRTDDFHGRLFSEWHHRIRDDLAAHFDVRRA